MSGKIVSLMSLRIRRGIDNGLSFYQTVLKIKKKTRVTCRLPVILNNYPHYLSTNFF